MAQTFTIALVNQKGGVGKTTISTNLAACAHLLGHRTLILDFDEQSSALDWFAARADDSPLAGLSVAQVTKPLTRAAVASLTAGYDLAILDAPPRLGNMTLSAAVAADLILIPVQPSPFDLWAAGETLETLAAADEGREHLGLPPTDRLAVLNRLQAGTLIGREAGESAAGIARIAGISLHQRVAFATSATKGESVVTAEPDGAAAEEIRALFALVTAGKRLPRHGKPQAPGRGNEGTPSHGKGRS